MSNCPNAQRILAIKSEHSYKFRGRLLYKVKDFGNLITPACCTMVNDNKGIVSETTSSSFNSHVIVFHRLDLYSHRGLGDTIKFKIKDYSIRNNKKYRNSEKFKKKFKELKLFPILLKIVC